MWPESWRSTPCADGAAEAAGVVREQHHGARGSRPASARAEVFARAAHPVAAVIVHAREVEALRAADRDALVAQHAHAELAHPLDPGLAARVDVVVARHEEDAVAPAQGGEGRDLVAQALDAPSTRSPVTATRSGASAFTRSVSAAAKPRPSTRADVDVADLHDAEAVERARPARQRDLDAPHRRHPQPVAQREPRRRRHARRHQRGTRARDVASRVAPISASTRSETRERDEGQPEQAHPDQEREGDDAQPAAARSQRSKPGVSTAPTPSSVIAPSASGAQRAA